MRKKKATIAWCGCVILFLSWNAMALEPYWAGNYMLFFQNEPGEVAKKTRYVAAVSGVETWYWEYKWYIEQYAATGAFSGWIYNGTNWVKIQIDPTSLTQLIWSNPELDLGDVPWDETYNEMIEAFNSDRNGTSNAAYYDPYSWFKWRSVYMEKRHAENGDPARANANCWGTANYLAKDLEWVGEYEYTFPTGASDNGDRFPHIYVGGGSSLSGHTIDADLNNTYGNSKLMDWGLASDYPSPRFVLNMFDVIRLSSNPTGSGPFMFGVDVGNNRHCLAYICTGEKRWKDIDPSSSDNRRLFYVYEKHNYGSTYSCPYGLNVLGHDDWAWDPPVGSIGQYDNDFNSYFKKYGYNKKNRASYWCESWPDVTQIPQTIRDDEMEYYGNSFQCTW